MRQDKHNHHVEGSNTSYNDNFSTLTQVLNLAECQKKKELKTNKFQLS
jgi:hypothetical protein